MKKYKFPLDENGKVTTHDLPLGTYKISVNERKNEVTLKKKYDIRKILGSIKEILSDVIMLFLLLLIAFAFIVAAWIVADYYIGNLVSSIFF